MTRILALDQSSRTGWAFGLTNSDPKEWLFGSFRTPKRPDDGDRLVIFRDGLVGLIETHWPDLIVYETPFTPVHDSERPQGDRARFNVKVWKYLTKIEGVLEETCSRHDVPYESYPSQSWRVTALGFGRLPKGSPDNFKQLMTKRARALGLNVRDDNEADAIGLLMHALMGKPASNRQQGDLLASLKATL